MTDLTGKKIANTYKDLLQIDSASSNSGVDGTLRNVQDGGGASTSLKLSQTEAAFSGNVSVNGNMAVVGTFQPDTVNASEIVVSTLNATNITTSTINATNLTFQDVSVSSLRTGNFKATTISAGTVSATTVAATNITLAGEPVATSAGLAAVSSTMATSIANVSAALETRIAGVSSTFASTSATLESHINTVSATLSSTNATLQTSIANVSSTMATSIANVSAALETRIAAVSAEVSAVKALVTASNASAIAANTSSIAVNSAAITSVNTRINAVSVLAETKASASTSANLETRINAVSVLTSVNAAAIASVDTIAKAAASASTSATLETRIASVSVLTKTNLDAIASVNTIAVAAASAGTSATLETRIAAVSATMATSIANVSALIPTSLTDLNISDGTNGQFLKTNGSSVFTFASIAGGGGSGTMTELKAGTNIALLENGTTVTETTTSATINVVGVASAGTSAALETRIAAVSGLTKTNLDAIASVDTIAKAAASASTSATLETRIAAVSVLTKTNLDAIASVDTIAKAAASATTSATLETRIAAVSATMATSIGNSNTAIATLSATMATSVGNSNTAIATLSATMATSIGNQLPKAGGTMTGNLLIGSDSGDAFNASSSLRLQPSSGSNYIQIKTGTSDNAGLLLGDTDDDFVGGLIYSNSSNHLEFYSNNSERARLESDGDWHADGNVVAYSTTISDKRLKKDIQTIENALWRINQLTGCTFTYLKDDRKSAGLIAQDVEKILPSAVIDTEAVFHGEKGETYKTLQYDQVIGLLVEAVKELTAKVEELENASSR